MSGFCDTGGSTTAVPFRSPEILSAEPQVSGYSRWMKIPLRSFGTNQVEFRRHQKPRVRNRQQFFHRCRIHGKGDLHVRLTAALQFFHAADPAHKVDALIRSRVSDSKHRSQEFLWSTDTSSPFTGHPVGLPPLISDHTMFLRGTCRPHRVPSAPQLPLKVRRPQKASKLPLRAPPPSVRSDPALHGYTGRIVSSSSEKQYGEEVVERGVLRRVRVFRPAL